MMESMCPSSGGPGGIVAPDAPRGNHGPEGLPGLIVAPPRGHVERGSAPGHAGHPVPRRGGARAAGRKPTPWRESAPEQPPFCALGEGDGGSPARTGRRAVAEQAQGAPETPEGEEALAELARLLGALAPQLPGLIRDLEALAEAAGRARRALEHAHKPPPPAAGPEGGGPDHAPA